MTLLALALVSQGFVHEPFGHYALEMHHGFRIYVSYEARKNNHQTQPALDLLNKQIGEMIKIVPPNSLETLRKIPVFVEHENPKFPCACYHPGAQWLKENGFIPEKLKAVEISNTKNYVDWVHMNQPFMTLHEYAHGFHDLKYGYQDKYILACYRNAVASKKYEEVAHNRGGKKRAYGLNDQMEYFAELTEAYFGENDFYPFNRAQLKEFDPEGYEMIEKAWGVKK